MSKHTKHFFHFLNRFIFIMTAADFLLFSAYGLMGPILAVYLTEQVTGGSLEIVGYGSMVYFIATSLFKIPVAKLIDKNMAEYDDFYVTVAGYFLMSIIPFLFIFISKPIHLYLVQALSGFGTAIAYPGWMALFTRHLRKGEEGTTWGFYATSANFGAGIAAAVGGIVAAKFGFHLLFFIVGSISMLATICLLFNRREIITKGHVPKVARIGGKINKKDK